MGAWDCGAITWVGRPCPAVWSCVLGGNADCGCDVVCRLSSAAVITLGCAAASTCAVTGVAATVVLEPALAATGGRAAVGACGELGVTAVGGSAQVAPDWPTGPPSEGWVTRSITALPGDTKTGASSASWSPAQLTGRFLRTCAAALPFFSICLTTTTSSSSSSNCACMRWRLLSGGVRACSLGLAGRCRRREPPRETGSGGRSGCPCSFGRRSGSPCSCGRRRRESLLMRSDCLHEHYEGVNERGKKCSPILLPIPYCSTSPAHIAQAETSFVL